MLLALKPPMKLPAAYKIRDVAERLAVTDGRVLEWIKAGRLRAIDVSEGSGKRHRWRIMPEALAEFEQNRTAVTQSRAQRRRPSGWTYQYF